MVTPAPPLMFSTEEELREEIERLRKELGRLEKKTHA
jgi:hypothetical protein